MFTDHQAQSRFELTVGEHIALADYVREEGQLIITHVFTPPELRGGGVAAQLMAHIAKTARTQQLRLLPLCSYAKAWMARHPD